MNPNSHRPQVKGRVRQQRGMVEKGPERQREGPERVREKRQCASGASNEGCCKSKYFVTWRVWHFYIHKNSPRGPLSSPSRISLRSVEAVRAYMRVAVIVVHGKVGHLRQFKDDEAVVVSCELKIESAEIWVSTR